MRNLEIGDRGPEVARAQTLLAHAGHYRGAVDGIFGPNTERAVREFQAARFVSGEIDDTTWDALAAARTEGAQDLATVAAACRLLPDAPRQNVEMYWPEIVTAMRADGLGDRTMLAMALGTVAAETGSFAPISEYRSRYNTARAPFDLYDAGTRIGKRLGNTEPGDGHRFKGRGFVQLTGRDNYRRIGAEIGADLEANPDLANDPICAARILSAFLKRHEHEIRAALGRGDLAAARRLVNGGSHGLDRFAAVTRAALA